MALVMSGLRHSEPGPLQKKIAKEIKKFPAKTSRKFMKLKITTLEFLLPKAPILWQYQKWDTLLQASLLPFHV